MISIQGRHDGWGARAIGGLVSSAAGGWLLRSVLLSALLCAQIASGNLSIKLNGFRLLNTGPTFNRSAVDPPLCCRCRHPTARLLLLTPKTNNRTLNKPENQSWATSSPTGISRRCLLVRIQMLTSFARRAR